MTKSQLLAKTSRVINSCENLAQVAAATKYLDRMFTMYKYKYLIGTSVSKGYPEMVNVIRDGERDLAKKTADIYEAQEC